MWADISLDDDLSWSEKEKVKEVLERKLKWNGGREEKVAGAKNLMVWRDQSLLVWGSQDVCVYCFWLKDEKRITGLQILALSKPPLFDVDSLQFSASGRYLAVTGSRGINIVELPQKWGAQNVYEAGKSPIPTRSWSLDERFFVCNQKVLLLDARWHPASQDEKHIVLLTNDNCVRIYNIHQPHLVDQEIKLSATRVGRNESYFSLFASSLGEVAVSFDFGPPVPKNAKPTSEDVTLVTAKSDCLWPMYILKGNGDLLVVYTNLENPYLSQRVLGPLTMLPPAEDNYGVDACRLICLNCLPPLIVIATSSGILYHCIALTNGEDTHSSQSILPKPTIFVCECVELTLSLTSNDDEDILSPIRLFHDPFGPTRYFCGHAAGIHAISLPMVSCIQSEKLTFDEGDKSIVEHLVCTKPIATMKDSVSLYGFALSMRKGQQHMKILLSSGDILNQRLSLWPSSIGPLKNIKAESWLEPKVEFSDHIKEILKRNSSAPLLRSHQDEKSQEKKLQLLLSTTEVYREEYLAKMNLAAAAFERRLKNLKSEKDLQLSELAAFEEEKEKLLKSLTVVTEKYDSALERQSELSSRLDKIVEVLQNKQMELSDAEVRMLKDLRNMCEKLNVYREKIHKLQLLSKYQQELDESTSSLNLSNSNNRLQQVTLPTRNQIKNVKNILNKQGETISDLLHRVIRLKHNASSAL